MGWRRVASTFLRTSLLRRSGGFQRRTQAAHRVSVTITHW